MTTKVFGDKGGFTAAPKPGKPSAPEKKKGSTLVWVLAVIVIMAIAFVYLQRSGALPSFLSGGTPASSDQDK